MYESRVYVQGLPSLAGLRLEMSTLKLSEPGFGASVKSPVTFPGSLEIPSSRSGIS
jgi:hypothetical protein